MTSDTKPEPRKRPNGFRLTASSHYFGRGIHEVDEVVEEAQTILSKVNFDTIVVTGVSGALIGPILAYLMNKNIVVIRKNGIPTHGFSHEGVFGERWIFLDDFIASGNTLRYVKSEIDTLKKRYSFKTKYVGTYKYENRTFTYNE